MVPQTDLVSSSSQMFHFDMLLTQTVICVCREAVELRVVDGERVRLHRIMASYFGNLVSTEDREAKGVLSQVTWFASADASVQVCDAVEPVIWRPDVLPNRRRCAEAAHHMVKGGMFSEAVTELCSIESVCARAKCGNTEMFRMVAQLSEVVEAQNGVDRAYHYWRWLKKDVHRILVSPIPRISLTASGQPTCSVVRQEISQHFKSASVPLFDSSTESCEWMRARVMGGSSQFDACLSVLLGKLLVGILLL